MPDLVWVVAIFIAGTAVGFYCLTFSRCRHVLLVKGPGGHWWECVDCGGMYREQRVEHGRVALRLDGKVGKEWLTGAATCGRIGGE